MLHYRPVAITAWAQCPAMLCPGFCWRPQGQVVAVLCPLQCAMLSRAACTGTGLGSAHIEALPQALRKTGRDPHSCLLKSLVWRLCTCRLGDLVCCASSAQQNGKDLESHHPGLVWQHRCHAACTMPAARNACCCQASPVPAAGRWRGRLQHGSPAQHQCSPGAALLVAAPAVLQDAPPGHHRQSGSHYGQRHSLPA